MTGRGTIGTRRIAPRLAGLTAMIMVLGGCTVADPSSGPSAPPTPATSSSGGPPDQSGRSVPDTSRGGRSELPTATVRLAFGGDVMFEGGLRGLLDDPRTGLAPITPELSRADFTMINLEAAITTRGARDPKQLEDPDARYHFRVGAEALTALSAAGVDAVSVANNHGADFGARGLADTLRAKEAGTLPVVGVGRNRTEAYTPHRVTLQGQPFAFLAADASPLESTAPHWEAGATTAGLAAARGPGRAALLAAVRDAAGRGEVVVVYLHWGRENSTVVTSAQRSLAKALSEAGAAVVVGSHVHRLQAAGWLGSTYVAYGLGNLVWYHGVAGAETGLLELTVRDGRVVADGWRPAVIPRDGGLPQFRTGKSAASAVEDWRGLRAGSDLAAGPPGAVPAAPRFASSIDAITSAVRRRMASSYRVGCPVPLDDLRLVRVSHWDFAGRVRSGELVVAAEHAPAVVTVFGRLFAARFPIERMRLVSAYGSDDDRSMAANNTSAFNCRPVAGTDRWSQHSFGAAIDINPVQNPYVTNSVAPPAGAPYADPDQRRASVRGLITRDSIVVRAFRDVGWEWGGDWEGSKDYQHFSAAGS